MAAAVDWRLNRATADRFLRAFIDNAHGTGERDEQLRCLGPGLRVGGPFWRTG
jgi:hypothetical protein